MNIVNDLDNPTKEEIQLLLECVKKSVNDGNFVVLPRTNNKNFFADYNLEPDYIVPEIISELTIQNFCKCELSDNENHQGEIIYIFRSEKELTDIEEYTEIVEIYIKFTYEGEERIIFISFHDAKNDMYPYKWRV